MPKRPPSLTKWLPLLLALINSVHGKAVNSTDCPTNKASKLPDSMRVQMHIIRSNPDNTRAQDVRNRSMSPWDYRINEDPNRFPPEIVEANCRYNACVDATGQGGLNYNMNSVPIQQEILVLRRKQSGCQQTYWLEKQMVTVGCTCAFRTTSTNTNLRKNKHNYRDITKTNYGLK